MLYGTSLFAPFNHYHTAVPKSSQNTMGASNTLNTKTAQSTPSSLTYQNGKNEHRLHRPEISERRFDQNRLDLNA